MKLKKVLTLTLALALSAAMLSGCGGGSSDDGGGGDAKDAKKVALFMSHMSNAFTIELSDAVKAQATKEGFECVVNDASKDAAKQINQIETAVTQGVDAIIIEPVSVDGIIPAVKTARDAGIPVVIVNQQLSDPTAANCYVGVSNADGGEMEMTRAVEDLQGKGSVALLLGPMGSDAQIGRSEGYKRVLDKNPDVKVVFENSAEWDTDKALKLTENWLQSGKEINAIVSHNDGMALGAVKAVEDAKLQDKIMVYGLDATPDALAAVKEGRLAATVSQSTSEQGTQAVMAAARLIKGEDVEAEILVEFTLITKENVDQFLK